jgi:transposase
MSARRVLMHRLEELVRLHRMGTGAREAARLLGMSPNTERQYRLALVAEELLAGAPDALPSLEALKAAVVKHLPPAPVPEAQQSQIEPWREHIATLLAKGLQPRAAFERLRLEEPSFGGTYPQVKRLCRAMKRARGVRAEDVAIPVETLPGEIAQVDFGHVGKLLDPQTGKQREAWCFVMVLAFSRRMVVRVVFDQRIETWLRLHVEAFAELGGVIETVVPDNLKAAVVRAAFNANGTSELNRSYRELARHYKFKIDPTPPYAPEKKGKVEAGVRYVKHSFFRGRAGSDVEEVRRDLARWVSDVAGVRVHGTTGKRPHEVFDDVEKLALGSLPQRPFEPVEWRRATVQRDTHVAFDRRLYSVPWRLIGQSVWLRATAGSVCLYTDEERVATHDRRGPGLRSTKEEHLPEHRGDLRHRSRGHWEERATKMGQEVGNYIREVFESDDVLSQLRTAQSMVTHLEKFPVERARRACARAHHFGSYGYGALKTILRDALDLQPLPTTTPPAPPPATPRFARKVSDLYSPEVTNEPN